MYVGWPESQVNFKCILFIPLKMVNFLILTTWVPWLTLCWWIWTTGEAYSRSCQLTWTKGRLSGAFKVKSGWRKYKDKIKKSTQILEQRFFESERAKDRKKQPQRLLKSQCHRHHVIEMFLNFSKSVLTSSALIIPCRICSRIAEWFRSLSGLPAELTLGCIILGFCNYQDSHNTQRSLSF